MLRCRPGPRNIALCFALSLGLVGFEVAAFQLSIPALIRSPSLNSLTPHRPKESVAKCLVSLRSGATSATREQLTVSANRLLKDRRHAMDTHGVRLLRERMGCDWGGSCDRNVFSQQQVAAGSPDFDGSFDAGKVRIVGAVVERDGKYLMVERLKRSRGFFEFPGGKVEEGESDMDALVRELKEELNVEGRVLSPDTVSMGEDGPVQLVCYRAEIAGDPAPTEQGQLSYRWVERAELGSLAVPPADQAIIQALLAE